MGDWNLGVDPDCDPTSRPVTCSSRIVAGIEDVIIHPGYDRSGLRRDIGLIRMSISVPLSSKYCITIFKSLELHLGLRVFCFECSKF